LKTIFLIDDDGLVLRSAQQLLEREGFQVIPAKSGTEALEKASASEFDLILTDIRMPEKNGVETVRHIERDIKDRGGKEIPVIFITGYPEDAGKLKAEFYGEVIVKPFDNRHLLMTIREYL
jgi:CheY-like chemotaxis protein